MSTNGGMDKIANAVKDRRKKLGLDQSEVALIAGVSRKTVSEIEGGKRTIQFDMVTKVLTALGLSIEVH